MAKVRVQKRLYYKIGEACKALGIQPYVLRYWETEFPALAPSKSRSGQRVYNEKELEIIRRIKELLYGEGYTIAGAKKKLEGELASGTLGEPDGEAVPVQAGEAEAPPAPPSPPSPVTPRAVAPRPRAKAPVSTPALETNPLPLPDVLEAEPAPVLDTEGSQRIQILLSGIAEALGETRELLSLLDKKST